MNSIIFLSMEILPNGFIPLLTGSKTSDLEDTKKLGGIGKTTMLEAFLNLL